MDGHRKIGAGRIISTGAVLKAMSRFDGKISKIRSMTADTNVISDIQALAYYDSRLEEGEFLPPDEQNYYQRCRSSKKAIFIMLDFKVEKVGLPVVYKELLASPPLHLLYRQLFSSEAAISKESRRLAEKYAQAAGLEAADAAIVALASLNGIDILLSWNRHDIVKAAAIRSVEQINRQAGISTPEIMTPRDFLDRVMLTEKKTIALSPHPLLPVFRADSYLSKHGV